MHRLVLYYCKKDHFRVKKIVVMHFFKGILFTAWNIPIKHILMDIGFIISTRDYMVHKKFAFVFEYTIINLIGKRKFMK